MPPFFTRQEMEEINERCYYAKWGYDGLGGIGPIEPYAMHCAELRNPMPPTGNPFGARRNHKRGHGWKANHQS